SLRPKTLTASQLTYINNMCIIPKLVYMLQIAKVSEKTCNKIHQPLIRLIKNKMELPATAGNYIVTCNSLGGCKNLWHAILNKRIKSLHTRLNSDDMSSALTKLRIERGWLIAGVTESYWKNSTTLVNEYIWKNNLACTTLEQGRKLGLSFRSPFDKWSIEGQ
ncbi:36814_t:CDS:1, partial [Gigaspora margarita]